MRCRWVVGGLLACFLVLGSFASRSSAHDWGRFGGGHFGTGPHDFVPHWHFYATPYGSYGYYGLGLHDFVPHYHYYSSPYYSGYGGFSSGYYAPSWGYAYPYYGIYPRNGGIYSGGY
jgi:hypothetical protein